MKTKKVIGLFLIFMLMLTKTAEAIPISDVYKQGMYTITDKNKFTGSATLTVAGTSTVIEIIDANGTLKVYKRFDIVNQAVNLGIIEAGDTIIVIGNGELYLSFNYIKY